MLSSRFRKEPLRIKVKHAGTKYVLLFLKVFDSDMTIAEEADEIAILTFRSDRSTIPENCSMLNMIEKKFVGNNGIWHDTTREDLQKRGIRLEPAPWRYTVGLI